MGSKVTVFAVLDEESSGSEALKYIGATMADVDQWFDEWGCDQATRDEFFTIEEWSVGA